MEGGVGGWQCGKVGVGDGRWEGGRLEEGRKGGGWDGSGRWNGRVAGVGGGKVVGGRWEGGRWEEVGGWGGWEGESGRWEIGGLP